MQMSMLEMMHSYTAMYTALALIPVYILEVQLSDRLDFQNFSYRY